MDAIERRFFFSERDEWLLIRIFNIKPKAHTAAIKYNLTSIELYDSKAKITRNHNRVGLKTWRGAPGKRYF